MRHLASMLLGSLVALFSATNAHATAVYKWHSTVPGPYVTATGGELAITNAAYFSGSIDFHVHDPDTSPWIQYGDPWNSWITNSPVISASLTFSLTEGGWVPGVYTEPGSVSFSEEGFPFTGVLTFNGDGTLSGDLFLYDISDEANASGTHYNWSVFNYGSDYFDSEECGPPTCDGGSGYWQLSSVSVPEPTAWPLFAFGMLGLLGMVGLRRNS
jgi:hypothetical protein